MWQLLELARVGRLFCETMNFWVTRDALSELQVWMDDERIAFELSIRSFYVYDPDLARDLHRELIADDRSQS